MTGARAGRDLARELRMLTEAGGWEYAAAVAARLDAGAEDYGESFAWCARSRLWSRLAQESVDVGAYSALTLRRLELDGTAPRQLERLRALLLSIARHGAEAEALISEARRLAEGTAEVER